VAKKLSDRVLNDKDFEDIKIQYNEHMVRYHTEKANYMDLFRCWHNIYNTDLVKDDEDRALKTLTTVAGFLVLAQRDPEQHDLLLKVKAEDNMDKLPHVASMLKKFLTQELINWDDFNAANKAALYGQGAFEDKDRQEVRWTDLKKRITEHSIFVISSNYSRITMARLAEMTCLSAEETEAFLCDMVSGKQLYAKIDRPAGLVVFKKAPSAEELLNGWGNDIKSLLDLVEKSCHLIYKENIAHKIK